MVEIFLFLVAVLRRPRIKSLKPIPPSYTFVVNVQDFLDDLFEYLENSGSSFVTLLQHDAAEAIYNSNSTEKFERDLLQYVNKVTNEARGDCDANLKRRGKRVSMMPPNSKRKKTHGTAHMR